MRDLSPCTRLEALAIVVVLLSPVRALLAGTEQNTYSSTVEVAGKRLELVGTGLREKWFFDVYEMGAYSESGRCDAEALISADEVKYIRIDMRRNVSADKIAGALNKSLRKNLPAGASADLQAHVDTFLSQFKRDLSKGARMELTYVPGVGTTVTQNGEQQAPAAPSKAVADVLWSSYFSSKTCCRKLKAQILSGCLKQRGGGR